MTDPIAKYFPETEMKVHLITKVKKDAKNLTIQQLASQIVLKISKRNGKGL